MWKLFSFGRLPGSNKNNIFVSQIDNPAYKGPWIHPEIDNPEYVSDPDLYKRPEICTVGLDLWQVGTDETGTYVVVYSGLVG